MNDEKVRISSSPTKHIYKKVHLTSYFSASFNNNHSYFSYTIPTHSRHNLLVDCMYLKEIQLSFSLFWFFINQVCLQSWRVSFTRSCFTRIKSIINSARKLEYKYHPNENFISILFTVKPGFHERFYRRGEPIISE